jgi:hypothetical protein
LRDSIPTTSFKTIYNVDETLLDVFPVGMDPEYNRDIEHTEHSGTGVGILPAFVSPPPIQTKLMDQFRPTKGTERFLMRRLADLNILWFQKKLRPTNY